MRKTGTRGNGGRWRPAVAMLALYALVLQAVLGGAALWSVGGPMKVRCLPLSDGSGSGLNPAHAPDGKPGHRHDGCCTAAPPVPVADMPASPVFRPLRRAIRLAWTPQEMRVARPPLDRLARARAPPVA